MTGSQTSMALRPLLKVSKPHTCIPLTVHCIIVHLILDSKSSSHNQISKIPFRSLFFKVDIHIFYGMSCDTRYKNLTVSPVKSLLPLI